MDKCAYLLYTEAILTPLSPTLFWRSTSITFVYTSLKLQLGALIEVESFCNSNATGWDNCKNATPEWPQSHFAIVSVIFLHRFQPASWVYRTFQMLSFVELMQLHPRACKVWCCQSKRETKKARNSTKKKKKKLCLNPKPTAISTIYLSASFIVVFLCIATTETWPLSKRYNKKNHSNVIGNKERLCWNLCFEGKTEKLQSKTQKTTKRTVNKKHKNCVIDVTRNLCA